MQMYNVSNANIFGVAKKVKILENVSMKQGSRLLVATRVPTYEVKTVVRADGEEFVQNYIFLDMQSALEFMEACMHEESFYYFPVEGVIGVKKKENDAELVLFKNGFEEQSFADAVKEMLKAGAHNLQQIGIDKNDLHKIVEKFKKLVLSKKHDLAMVANYLDEYTTSKEDALCALTQALQIEKVKLLPICDKEVFDAFREKQLKDSLSIDELVTQFKQGTNKR